MIPIIDNGHSGKIAGYYLTRGKCYTFADGTTIYEGEFNRAIKARVLETLDFKGIPYIDLVPEHTDISLKERVQRANNYHKKYKGKTFLLSIHADAGGGSGSGAFVSTRASKKSRHLAFFAQTLFATHFPESRHRGIKKRKHYITTYSDMPAVLLENFFMDNEKECKKYLLTKEGRDRIAAYIVATIEQYIKQYA